MVVVKVELWPHGNASRAKRLGTLWIANVGGTLTRGNYKTALTGDGEIRAPWPIYDGKNEQSKPLCTGEVKGYARISRPVWDLVRMALGGLGHG